MSLFLAWPELLNPRDEHTNHYTIDAVQINSRETSITDDYNEN
jgi:hypothetical protein